jgi:SAM-dependent methyltransferase
MWSPYDEDTYRFVIDRVGLKDVVLDIGAGDVRLSRRLAAIASKVYAIERNAEVLAQADRSGWPENLIVVHADALTWPFPKDVTLGVLLMRHCAPAHFADYVARLKAAGCGRLMTNARWKMAIEEIDLRTGAAYDPDRMGWYACACGSIGFTPGDPKSINQQLLEQVTEVISCPNCGV